MTTPCAQTPLPEYDALTEDQARGRACVACGKPLGDTAVLAGLVMGHEGPYPMTANAWACPPGAGQ